MTGNNRFSPFGNLSGKSKGNKSMSMHDMLSNTFEERERQRRRNMDESLEGRRILLSSLEEEIKMLFEADNDGNDGNFLLSASLDESSGVALFSPQGKERFEQAREKFPMLYTEIVSCFFNGYGDLAPLFDTAQRIVDHAARTAIGRGHEEQLKEELRKAENLGALFGPDTLPELSATARQMHALVSVTAARIVHAFMALVPAVTARIESSTYRLQRELDVIRSLGHLPPQEQEEEKSNDAE